MKEGFGLRSPSGCYCFTVSPVLPSGVLLVATLIYVYIGGSSCAALSTVTEVKSSAKRSEPKSSSSAKMGLNSEKLPTSMCVYYINLFAVSVKKSFVPEFDSMQVIYI